MLVNTESKLICIFLQGTLILVPTLILMIFLLDVKYFFGVLNFPWKLLHVTWWNRNKHSFGVSVFVRDVTVPIGEHAVLTEEYIQYVFSSVNYFQFLGQKTLLFLCLLIFYCQLWCLDHHRFCCWPTVLWNFLIKIYCQLHQIIYLNKCKFKSGQFLAVK